MRYDSFFFSSSSGSPAEKPSASMRRLAGCRYTFSVSTHDGLGAATAVLAARSGKGGTRHVGPVVLRCLKHLHRPHYSPALSHFTQPTTPTRGCIPVAWVRPAHPLVVIE